MSSRSLKITVALAGMGLGHRSILHCAGRRFAVRISDLETRRLLKKRKLHYIFNVCCGGIFVYFLLTNLVIFAGFRVLNNEFS